VRENGKGINKMRAADRGPEKAGVGGSIPSLATTLSSLLSALLTCSSVCARFVPWINRIARS